MISSALISRILEQGRGLAIILVLATTAGPVVAESSPLEITREILAKQRSGTPWTYDLSGFTPKESGWPAFPLPDQVTSGTPGAAHYDARRGLLYAMSRGGRDTIYEIDTATRAWRVVADGGPFVLRGVVADPGMDGILTGFVKRPDYLGLLRINPRTGMRLELRFSRSAFQALPDGKETRVHVIGGQGSKVAVLVEVPPSSPLVYLLDIELRSADLIGVMK